MNYSRRSTQHNDTNFDLAKSPDFYHQWVTGRQYKSFCEKYERLILFLILLPFFPVFPTLMIGFNFWNWNEEYFDNYNQNILQLVVMMGLCSLVTIPLFILSMMYPRIFNN